MEGGTPAMGLGEGGLPLLLSLTTPALGGGVQSDFVFLINVQLTESEYLDDRKSQVYKIKSQRRQHDAIIYKDFSLFSVFVVLTVVLAPD